MKNLGFKKCLSLLLSIIMIFTMLPVGIFALDSVPYPTMMEFTAASSADFHKYWNKVYTVTFLDRIDTDAMNGAVESWDISAEKNGSVMGWMYLNEEATAAARINRYDVYIAGDGGVAANPKSGFIFYLFSELVEVSGLEHFKTDAATTFKSMFENCYKLAKVDFKNNKTENLTSMENMFKNCYELTELDLSSFNTKKVTTLRFAFYLCKKIEHIYVGDGWSLESIANLNDGIFNCCYAKLGVTEEEYAAEVANGRQFDVSASKATTEAGGFLTYKVPDAPQEYKVTYKFIGDIIPENVIAPEVATYEEGTTVTVEENASAEHYIFSGWSTEDADVENGEFVINNDVEFVGSWTKLYKVEYKYDEKYEVPADAPEIPDVELWYAPGEDVPVYGVPYAHEHVFVGWNTEDAEVAGDSFIMPENDVVFYGFYKIPVESVEITDGEDITIDIDDEDVKINVYVNPEDATIKDIVYESSDETVVTVDDYGNITPVGEGTATVTVKSVDNPGKRDTITVTVKTPVTEMIVDKTEITLDKGDKDKIDAKVNDDATNKELIYESNDPGVVKVDSEGNVVAVGEGTATITVTSKDNKNIKKEITVTVKVPVTELTVTEDFTLNIGDEKNVDAKVNEDATNKELIYESSDPGVVKVDSEGNVVAVGEGEAIITVTSKDNPAYTETVTVTVKIPVADIEVEKDEITLTEGNTDKITVTVTPENATDKEVTFESSDETVVKVDEKGNFEAVGEGEATITITSKDDPTVKETVTVTVLKKIFKVTYGFIGEVVPENIEAPTMKQYKDGSTVKVEADSTADGYRFSGWSTSDAVVEDGEFTISNDVHFVGSWEKINYYGVTYKYEGDVPANAPAVPDKETYEEGSNITVEKVPSLEGYNFIGWDTDDVTVTDGKFTINNDVEFVGKWEKIIVGVDGIVADKTEIELEIGDKDKIEITVTPEDATDKEVTFESSDETVVKVDENGNIEAVGEGEATITITSKDDPTVKETVTVTVLKKIFKVTYGFIGEVVPENIEAPTMKQYKDGSTVKVEADSTANGYRFSGWSTSDAVVEDGEFTISNDVHFVGSWEKINYYGVTYKYEGDVPANAPAVPDKETYEEGSNVTVKKVPSLEGYTFIGWETDDVTVTDGGFEIYNDVKFVGKWEKIIVGVDGIVADKTEIELEIGDKDKITVTVTPDDATDKELTFESSDETVVKVDEDGNIEAVGEGEATITITSNDDPTVKETVIVKVEKKEETEEPEEPEYVFEVSEEISVKKGATELICVKITPNDGRYKPTFLSADEGIAKVDEFGNVTGVSAGTTTIYVDFGNGIIRPVAVTVIAPIVPDIPSIPKTHYVSFGKTDGIGWYEVSVNGGDFFPQGPNSTLQVTEGSILVVRVQDMWIDDEFDFYVNGKKVPLDPANTITVVVDGYMLIGALSMDVEVPDIEESLNIFQRIIKAIKEFFQWIGSWFK